MKTNRLLAFLLLLLGACGSATPQETRRDFPAPETLAARPEYPDPLVSFDGRKVETREQWEKARKPELKALFQHYMYGFLIPPVEVTGQERRSDPGAFGGKATLREITLKLGPKGYPLNLLLVVPNKRPGPAPVFVGLNFTGNHTLVTDPAVSIPTAWMRSSGKGDDVVNNRATEKGRGKNIGTWALEQSIDRGYAVATVYYGDIFPDKPDFNDGVFPVFFTPHPGQKSPGAVAPGAIAMWAWGLHRIVDYLVTVPELDRSRIAVTGHSRLGKTALLAAAFDERIAHAIPHQAGCGGTTTISSSSTRRTTESPSTSTAWWRSARRARSSTRTASKTSGPTPTASSRC